MMVDTQISARTEINDESVLDQTSNEEDWELSDHVRNLLKQREELLEQLYHVDCNIRQTTAEILDTLSVVTVVLERQMGVKFDENQGAHEALQISENEAEEITLSEIEFEALTEEGNNKKNALTEETDVIQSCSDSQLGGSHAASDADGTLSVVFDEKCGANGCARDVKMQENLDVISDSQSCPDIKGNQSCEGQKCSEISYCSNANFDSKNNISGDACGDCSESVPGDCQSTCPQNNYDNVKLLKNKCENSSPACSKANKENCGDSAPQGLVEHGAGDQPLKTLSQLHSMQGSLLKQEKYVKKIERNHKLRPADSLVSSDSANNQGSLKVPHVLESQLAKIQHNIGQARRQLQTLQQQLRTLATRRHQLQPHPDNCLVDAELTKTEARLQQIMMRLELASLRKDIVHQMMT